ncbi:hypothetical protein CK501_12670 [Halovibrio salipaludis]|uniref:DUF4112 domain-containing protein n=1 Tax=Halovibrio salipaludis TaxID=2032626 RepID=A0A2A2F4L4_9GAMM|nr:DUF4112 domain-containing protein [Halovibrio salipaludis]PAU79654.1 hypothetical protein CK501_12670 [Halovibrio salipaludis]
MSEIPARDPEHERATLARLERFARLTDSRFRVPFTGIRFGIGPLIGLIPGVGDFAGLVLSLYLIQQARQIGAPRSLQLRMLGNGLVDAVGGTLPVAGDVFDVFYRANNRNVTLLREHLESRVMV